MYRLENFYYYDKESDSLQIQHLDSEAQPHKLQIFGLDEKVDTKSTKKVNFGVKDYYTFKTNQPLRRVLNDGSTKITSAVAVSKGYWVQGMGTFGTMGTVGLAMFGVGFNDFPVAGGGEVRDHSADEIAHARAMIDRRGLGEAECASAGVEK